MLYADNNSHNESQLKCASKRRETNDELGHVAMQSATTRRTLITTGGGREGTSVCDMSI